MERKVICAGISILVLAVLLVGIVLVQALGTSFTLGITVYDTDGTTPVDGVTVTVTNLETGSSVTPEVTADGGKCIVNLANLAPNEAHSEGDNIQFVADDGFCKMNTTVVPRAATSPQFVDLTLQANDTAPTITDLQPADGACVNDGTPEICANYSDASGIDTSSVTITVGGTDVTTSATVTETSVCYTPTTSLGEGGHTVMVNVSDICGNPSSMSWAFSVDTIAPAIEFNEPPTPANNSEVTVNYVNMGVNVTDDGCGIDNVRLIWNGTIWTGVGFTMFRTAAGQNSFIITADLPDFEVTDLPNGEYTYWVEANDTAGNSGMSESRVVTVNVTEYNFTLEFVTGYNLISVPVNDTSVTNASLLAAKIGANCTEVIKWNTTSQEFVSHLAGWSLNDFDIAGGEGYFVNIANQTSVEFVGDGWTSPFEMSLAMGYNIIGMPVNDNSVTNASLLAAKIGGNCTEIVKWDSAEQKYVSHLPGWPTNNFDIAGGEGYFVNLANPTDVTFVGVPWAD